MISRHLSLDRMGCFMIANVTVYNISCMGFVFIPLGSISLV